MSAKKKKVVKEFTQAEERRIDVLRAAIAEGVQEAVSNCVAVVTQGLVAMAPTIIQIYAATRPSPVPPPAAAPVAIPVDLNDPNPGIR